MQQGQEVCALHCAAINLACHDKEQTQREVHAHAESIAHGGSACGGRGEDAELVRVLGPRAEESGSADRALLQQARTAALVFT
jgi:hypothetical protein